MTGGRRKNECFLKRYFFFFFLFAVKMVKTKLKAFLCAFNFTIQISKIILWFSGEKMVFLGSKLRPAMDLEAHTITSLRRQLFAISVDVEF